MLGGAAANDALISSNADYVGAGIGPLLTLWDKTQTTLRVKAIGGLDASTLQLLTTNPAVKTLGDLTPADRIAVPAVKVSQQAVLLQMAAEQLWGQGQHERLDALTIALPHSEAVPALLAGVSGVTGHFSNEPFQTKELASPKVHALTSSEQILGGPATVSALYTTGRFRDRNPEVNRFVLNALAEAHALIASRPGEGACRSCWRASPASAARPSCASSWPRRRSATASPRWARTRWRTSCTGSAA